MNNNNKEPSNCETKCYEHTPKNPYGACLRNCKYYHCKEQCNNGKSTPKNILPDHCKSLCKDYELMR